MTLREQLVHDLRLRGWSRLDAEDRAEEVLSRCAGQWADCLNASRTLEIVHGIGVPVMRCLLTGRHPDECAAIAIEAQRAVTTQIGTVRSTKARAESIAQTPKSVTKGV